MNRDDLLRIYHFGGSGSSPTPPPAVPSEDSPEMKQAAREAAEREALLARKKKGRQSTILTSPMGLLDNPTLGLGTLLSGKTKLGQ